jgi:hypothetical protein
VLAEGVLRRNEDGSLREAQRLEAVTQVEGAWGWSRGDVDDSFPASLLFLQELRGKAAGPLFAAILVNFRRNRIGDRDEEKRGGQGHDTQDDLAVFRTGTRSRVRWKDVVLHLGEEWARAEVSRSLDLEGGDPIRIREGGADRVIAGISSASRAADTQRFQHQLDALDSTG